MTNSKTFSVVTLVICLLALTMVVVARPAEGQVLHVPGDYSTIQAAVDAAAAGNTVQVKAGIYNENVVVSTSAVRLHATSGVVLDGTGLSGIGILVRGTSVASPVSDVEVSGFEVRNFETRHYRAVGRQRARP